VSHVRTAPTMPSQSRWRAAALEANSHSEPLGQIPGWLPEITAYLISGAAEMGSQPSRERLQALEQGTTERTFRLIEAMLRLGATRHCPCYDPDAIIERVEPVLALCKAFDAARRQPIEEKDP
jgi:hypothetical protein